jgi:hypothetical protein
MVDVVEGHSSITQVYGTLEAFANPLQGRGLLLNIIYIYPDAILVKGAKWPPDIRGFPALGAGNACN